MREEVKRGEFHIVAKGMRKDGREDGSGLDEEVGGKEAENGGIGRLDDGVDVDNLDWDLLTHKFESDYSSGIVEDVVYMSGSKEERSDENRSGRAESCMKHDRHHTHAEGNLFHNWGKNDVAEGVPVDLGL